VTAFERSTAVVINTGYGPQPRIAAWQESGLAVHLDHTLDGFLLNGDSEPLTEQPEGWFIAQVRSGFAVVRGVETEDGAIALARLLLTCGDWTQEFFSITADAKLYRAAGVILGAAGHPIRAYSAARMRRQLRQYRP
jgi:hypothetical protein